MLIAHARESLLRVFVEDAQEQRAFVAKRSVQTALAQTGGGRQVVNRRGGVAVIPEPVAYGRQSLARVEFPRSTHATKIGAPFSFVQAVLDEEVHNCS